MPHNGVVLVADDDPLGQKILVGILQSEGYTLASAMNGVEALQKAAQIKPDLILLDVMMPELDGFETCIRLRADPELAEVPVIMVTALDDRASRVRGLDVGADDFITKPVDPLELRARVRTTVRINRYRRLMNERARFAWVIEHADDGYLLVNAGLDIRYVNSQARRYLYLPRDDEPIMEPFIAVARRSYRLHPAEQWEHWSVTDPQPGPLMLVRSEVGTDPTWLQVEVAEVRDDLEGVYLLRLRDVSASITERRQVWSFHALVNHKLRTYSSLLSAPLEMLDGRWDAMSDLNRQKVLRVARDGAQRLIEAIEGVFEYLKTVDRATEQQGSCQIGSIPAIIAEGCTIPGIRTAAVRISGADTPADTYVAMDRQVLELIFWELLQNACKFHPQHNPVVQVDIRLEEQSVAVDVSDNGRTLTPAQLSNIWLPYYQGERFFTGEVPGMGLGLSSVAALVLGVGGRVSAENRTDGPGLTIKLNLPLDTHHGMTR